MSGHTIRVVRPDCPDPAADTLSLYRECPSGCPSVRKITHCAMRVKPMEQQVTSRIRDAVLILEYATQRERRAKFDLERVEDEFMVGNADRAALAAVYETWNEAAGVKARAELALAQAHAAEVA